MQTKEELCGDCPPVGYPTDKTRCGACPRRMFIGGYFTDRVERGDVPSQPESND